MTFLECLLPRIKIWETRSPFLQNDLNNQHLNLKVRSFLANEGCSSDYIIATLCHFTPARSGVKWQEVTLTDLRLWYEVS